MRVEVKLPDLGLDDLEIVASMWLVEVGAEVSEGDRVLEVLAGNVTVDISTPASGVFVEALVGEDETLTPGQVLAIIETPLAA